MCYDVDFNSVWTSSPYCLWKGLLKQDFLDIYLTTFSESIFSQTQKLWGSSFFSKYSKFNLNFKNAGKNSEKGLFFLDNCVWIGIVKFSLLTAGYILSAANVLRRSSKISHVNKRDFFDYKFPASNQLIWSMFYDAEFHSVWACLPYCLSKGFLKQEFLDIYLTTFSESVTSEIQKLSGSSFFKNVQNLI